MARRTLDPKQDYVFWRLFSAEQNRALLIDLLSAVLRPASPITDLELLQREPEKNYVDEKGIALDLRVRLSGGERIDVEMQTQRHAGLTDRILYYLTRMHAGQLARGAPYLRLRASVVILLANFTSFERPRFHSIFSFIEEYDHDRLPVRAPLAIHVVELPSVTAARADEEPSLLLWARFFNATNDDEREQLAREHPIMKYADEALEDLSADPIAIVEAEREHNARYAIWLDKTLTRDDALIEGRARGLEEGRAEGVAAGRAEGVAATLLTVLEARGVAITDEQRTRIRDCKDLQQLEQWTRRAVTASSADELFG